MSQSCDLRLPKDVKMLDVLDVISILVGGKVEWELPLERWVAVEGVLVSPSDKGEEIPESYNVYASHGYTFGAYAVYIRRNPHDNECHMAFWSYEAGDHILLSGGSSAFWKTINTELARFFGGEVDYNDCDDIQTDISFEKPRETNSPKGEKEWYKFQQDKANVKPITDWYQYTDNKEVQND